MSRSALKGLQAAAGAAGGGPVYVDDVFSTDVYKGPGSAVTITNGIDLSGEGGLVWHKSRTTSQAHYLHDTERGTLKRLNSNSNAAQTSGYPNGVASFNSDGFTFAPSSSYDGSSDKFVTWTFRKQPGFFDVVTYTGTGDTTGGSPTHRNIPHNLGVAPGMIITKRLDSSNSWYTWHRGVADDNAYFASTGFLDNDADFGGYQGFATNANQTSTHFAVRQNSDTADQTNRLGASYVAYLFAHDAQDFGEDSDEAIIKCGSYTGNGSSTGPTVDLGFEPQWLMIKKSSGSAGWYMYDNMRGVATGGNDALLYANGSSAETNNQNIVDFTSTGFQIVNADGDINASGASHIYMAIRRPHKPASEFAATQLLGLDKPTSGNKITPGFPADFGFTHNTTGSGGWYVGARLTQGAYTGFVNYPAESSHANYAWDSMTQFFTGYTWADYMSYGFRRAPGFFDVVTYTGNQTARQISHNLGAVPEMMWVKCRSQTRPWAVYLASQGNTKVAQLNDGGAFTADTSSWNNTSPTSTHFTVGDSATTNFNPEPMIAYLFASVPGISKIGTYTGTGTSSNVNVDCGFTNGARFVLIKWADDVSNWYVWDSVQGIVAGTEPYLRLSSQDAPVSTTDWIDPLSSGFTITNAAGNDVNTSGGTYMFYAIA